MINEWGSLLRRVLVMYYTYIVRCADKTLYTGWTTDLNRRLQAHNSGQGAKYTRSRRPVTLVYAERFESKNEAMSREWHIKKLRLEQKENLLRNAGKNPACLCLEKESL